MLHQDPQFGKRLVVFVTQPLLQFSLCKNAQGRFTVDGHPCPEFWVFHHHVMDSNSTPAESHDANFLGMTTLFQILQDRVNFSRMKEKLFKGNSLAVQWLGLRTFTAGARVQSLVGELRSSKLRGTAKKKKKKRGILWPLESALDSKHQW